MSILNFVLHIQNSFKNLNIVKKTYVQTQIMFLPLNLIIARSIHSDIKANNTIYY